MENFNRTHSLIFESGATGHRSEYLSHLMKYIIRQPELHGKYTFILNEKIQEKISQLCETKAFAVQYLKFEEKYSNSIQRSFSEWKLVSGVINPALNVKEIIFLEIDPFLILIAAREFKELNLAVKGILFQPYVHFQERKGGPWFFIRHIFRSYLFQKYSVAFNTNIQKLFILNDKKCLPVMNKKIKDIFYHLPDPIDNEATIIDQDFARIIFQKYGISPEKKVLLLFGAIDDRKNLINIIDALQLLPFTVKKTIHLVIAGPFDGNSREKYLAHITKAKNELSIAFNDQYIFKEEREVLFKRSDLVLMPYINFYSSSNVLGHAIKYSKNVIASKAGLVGRVVEENNIGITVNSLNIIEIKDAVTEILQKQKMFCYDSSRLLNNFSVEKFSETLLLEN